MWGVRCRSRGTVWLNATAACLVCIWARPLAAQSTTLTLSSNVLTYASPSVSDYTTGYICAGSVTASLARATAPNHDDVLLIGLAPGTVIQSTPAGFTKPLSDYQYSTNSDATCSIGTWQAVPASSATSATVHASARVPYTQTVYFRLKVTWTTDRGGVTYVLPTVNFYVNSP
jgi:hypothetical protein